ncbi:hypothetical protein ABEB36_001490 [Hypothenemus hampei]|uniref:Exonuclease domain-containing protein n=1 Tax=Hypothenemus hampei TaxID=57062 RepID=A0ABD1FEU7_HYPHA
MRVIYKKFLRKLSQIAMGEIKTFVFFDLETTGLPLFENNKTRITELTLLAIQNAHVSLGSIPRVQNKLSICFNPYRLICSDSERLTGLSNQMLEHMSPFNQNTVHMINNFLDHHPRPICLVAHNGNRFDYPILQAEIQKTGLKLLDDVVCIDSLEVFRDLHAEDVTEMNKDIPAEMRDNYDELLCTILDEYERDLESNESVKRALEVQKINETTPKKASKEWRVKNFKVLKASQRVSSRKSLNYSTSFKLVDIYQRLTMNQDPINAHQAEADVIMLALSAAKLGDRFVTWANKNHRPFSEMPPMVPGKKIGT